MKLKNFIQIFFYILNKNDWFIHPSLLAVLWGARRPRPVIAFLPLPLLLGHGHTLPLPPDFREKR
jgi:hypothetical protein